MSTEQAERFIEQLNASNAKKIAVIIVFGFILYHGFIHLKFGTNSCQWLLSKGRFKGDKEWQPYGCMMHKYTQTDTRHCYRYLAFWGNNNYFVFIGDLRLKLLFNYFINHIHPSDDDEKSIINIKNNENQEFVNPKLKFRAAFMYCNEATRNIIDIINGFAKEEYPPALLISSFTYSNFFNGNLTDDIIKNYVYNMTLLAKSFDSLSTRKTKILWKLQDRIKEDSLTFHWKYVTNKDIDKLNDISLKVFKETSVQVWESSLSIGNGLIDQIIEGYKISQLALKHNTQILLNMYCNDYMNYNDGTCCSSPEPYTILQLISYSIFGIFLIFTFLIFIRRGILYIQGHTFYTPVSTKGTTNITVTDLSTPIYSVAILGLILSYFYLCDRTNFFMKENKYYSEFSFWLPVGYVFALGLFFTEESRFTKALNPDQTDELKGWILVVVLIYYMTGADHIISIRMHVKVLISIYIFLIGYNNFTYIWQTGNFSLIKFFEIMFRINFLTVILCFCMNRPYQFYYFIPLISFWTCIIYITLALPPQITNKTVDNNVYHYLYLVIKFIILLSIITILYISEVFFERIFVTRPWKALFVTTDDDIHEWWYQWKLDRYTMIYGAIFASIFHIAQKNNIFDDNNHCNLFSKRISLTAILAAIIGIGFYTCFTFFCGNLQDCEEIHSYIVFIPIISYIILRNISGILRTRFSSFFAWFGRISFELFVCQYHIWLAANRHGVLVLLPGYPTHNMIITSFIFICISHEINRLTNILLPYAIPNDWKLALRNFVIFLIILLPIGRYDGML